MNVAKSETMPTPLTRQALTPRSLPYMWRIDAACGTNSSEAARLIIRPTGQSAKNCESFESNLIATSGHGSAASMAMPAENALDKALDASPCVNLLRYEERQDPNVKASAYTKTSATPAGLPQLVDWILRKSPLRRKSAAMRHQQVSAD